VNGVPLLLLVLALVVAAVVSAVWIRRRRSGHVLLAGQSVTSRRSNGRS
jgi:hypothetical protein